MTDCRFIIVRRGHFATYELLNRMFAGDPGVQIIWDRRIRERRQEIPTSEFAVLRRGDRRRRPPTQWSQLNYMHASDLPATVI